jgi:predicted RNase H-like nuclease (RuvC/YqgF family)
MALVVLLLVLVLLWYLYKSETSKLEQYNAKISELESNMAEATLKLGALEPTSVLSESIEKIKSDIATNMLTLTEELKQYVNKDAYDEEVNRVKTVIDRFSLDSKESIAQYQTEVAAAIDTVKKLNYEAAESTESMKEKLTSALNDYISLSSAKMQKIENDLVVNVTNNAKIVTEINASISKIASVIGDTSVPIYKDNVIDAIYSLNERMSVYEGKASDIVNMKSAISRLVDFLGSKEKLESNFWDYGKTLNPLVETMSELTKKDPAAANAIQTDFNLAYIAKEGKAITNVRLQNSLNKLKTACEKYAISLTPVESSLASLQADSRKIQLVDYITNLQESVLSLKLEPTEQKIADLKAKLDDIVITSETRSAEVTKEITTLTEQINSLNNFNELDEIKNTIKSLQDQSLQAYYAQQRLDSAETMIKYLKSAVGDWTDSRTIETAIEQIETSIANNKSTTDSLQTDLNKLKKLVGEYNITGTAFDMVIEAESIAKSAKEIIGNYNWQTWQSKNISETLDSFATKVFYLEKKLNEMPTSNSLSAIQTDMVAINDTIFKLKAQDTDFTTKYSELSKKTSEYSTALYNLKRQVDTDKKLSEIVTSINTKIETINETLDKNKTEIDKLPKIQTDIVTNFSELGKAIKDAETANATNVKELSNLSSTLISLTNTVSDLQSKMPAASTIATMKTQIESITTELKKIEMEQDQRNAIICLTKIYTFDFTGLPSEDQTFLKDNAGMLDKIKLVYGSVGNISNSQFYEELVAFNTRMSKIAAAPDLQNWITGYLQNSAFPNTEPLWFFIQRKLKDLTTTFNGLATKTELSEATAKLATVDQVKTVSDAIATINAAIGTFKQADYTALDLRVAALESKSTTSVTPLTDIINSSTASLKLLDSAVANQNFIIRLNVIKGVVSDGTKGVIDYPTLNEFASPNKPHIVDQSKVGFTSASTVNYIALSTFYNWLALLSSDRIKINNKISMFSHGRWQRYNSFSNQRITDMERFMYDLVINGQINTGPDITTATSITCPFGTNGYQKEYISTVAKRYDQPSAQTAITSLTKSDIITVIENAIKYSSITEDSISIYFGGTISGNAAGNDNDTTIPASTARIYLDPIKSAYNGTATLMNDTLNDFSSKGFDLSANVSATQPTSVQYLASNTTTTPSTVMCSANEFVCGVSSYLTTTTYSGGQRMSATPICCSFKK